MPAPDREPRRRAFAALACLASLALTSSAQPALAEEVDPFVTLPGWTVERTWEVEDLPPIRDQLNFGTCFANAAATVLQVEWCRANKRRCSTLAPGEMLSPIDLARFTEMMVHTKELDRRPEDEATHQAFVRKVLGEGRLTRADFPGVQLSGGDGFAVLLGASKVRDVALEGCVNTERLLGPTRKLEADGLLEGGDHVADLAAAAYERVKVSGQCRTAARCQGDVVRGAIATVSRYFDVEGGEATIRRALAQPDRWRFLEGIAIPERCVAPGRTTRLPPGMKWRKIEHDGTALNMEERTVAWLLRKAVVRGHLALYEGVCYAQGQPTRENCAMNDHAVVVSGLRKVCRGKECRWAVRVMNSWGPRWQREHDDGWVDLRAMVEQSTIGRSRFTTHWVQPTNFFKD